MKNTHVVKIVAPLEPWAVDVVRGVPELDAATDPDALLISEGGQETIVVEARRYVDAGTAHAIAAWHMKADGGPKVIVVAERSTQSAREILDHHGVAYIDGLGNASIRAPGLVVRTGSFTADATIVTKAKVPARLSGRAGLVAQAMMLDAGRRWKIADLASQTGVSAGLAHRVVARLEDIGLVSASGRGPQKVRHLTNQEGLLDLWVEEDREPRLRRYAGYVLPERGIALAPSASSALDEDNIDHAVTGVAAADLFESVLTAIPVTEIRITSRTSIDEVWQSLKGRSTEDGANLVLLQGEGDEELRFRERRGKPWVAARTRIYLDALRDPRRGPEQARAFRPYVLAGK